MSKERAYDLAQLCTQLVRKGNDFRTVWITVLKGHALVESITQSKVEGMRTVLEIRTDVPRLKSLAEASLSAHALD
jgi:hypothetical protein